MKKILTHEEAGLLFIWCIVVFLSFFHSYTSSLPFADTDDYMRLVYVLEYLEGKLGWYDHVIDRSNVPYGCDIHWTHLYDLILIAGTYAFRIFFDSTKDALLHWAMFVTPVISCFSIVLFYNICRHFLKKEMSFVCGILFIFTPYIYAQIRFCRPDHHGFLILLALLTIKYFIEFLNSIKTKEYIVPSIKLGLAYSLSITASPELLLIVAPLELFFIIYWLVFQESTKAFMTKSFAWMLQITICYAVFSSDGIRGISHIDYDKISIVHVYLALASFAFWAVLHNISNRVDCRTFQRRLKIIIFIGIPIAASIFLLFPKIIYLMSGNIDAEVKRLWLPYVQEMKSPLSDKFSHTFFMYITFISITVSGCIISLFNLKYLRMNNMLFVAFMNIATIVYVILGGMSYRILYYTAIFALPFICNFLQVITSSINSRWRGYVMMLIFMLSIYVIPITMSHDCKNKNIDKNALVSYFQKAKEQCVILANEGYGPMILFYTSHSVISTPYHRQTYGLLADHSVYHSTSNTLNDLKKILKESHITHLVFERKGKGYGSNIYKALFNKKPPKYLELQKANIRNIIIYKVLPQYL